MSPIILAFLSPAVVAPVVTFVISLIKRTPVVSDSMGQKDRNLILRCLGAVLSLAGIIGAFMLTGVTPDPSSLSDILVTLVLAVTTFFGATGVHEVAKD